MRKLEPTKIYVADEKDSQDSSPGLQMQSSLKYIYIYISTKLSFYTIKREAIKNNIIPRY